MLDHRKYKRPENKITSNHQKRNFKNNLTPYNYSNNKQDFLKSEGNIEIDGTNVQVGHMGRKSNIQSQFTSLCEWKKHKRQEIAEVMQFW